MDIKTGASQLILSGRIEEQHGAWQTTIQCWAVSSACESSQKPSRGIAVNIKTAAKIIFKILIMEKI
jgi:hypothetical protein